MFQPSGFSPENHKDIEIIWNFHETRESHVIMAKETEENSLGANVTARLGGLDH